MNKTKRFSPEVRKRAVQLVFDHQPEHRPQWAAIGSLAAKFGCKAETSKRGLVQRLPRSGSDSSCLWHGRH
jgi:transposase